MDTDRDPVAWLRGQVEARLELARKATQPPWMSEGDDPTDDEIWIDGDDGGWREVIFRGPQSHENMLHVAANDPRDTIARCEAELAILEYCEGALRYPANGPLASLARRTITALLGAYKHRTGFKAEWLP